MTTTRRIGKTRIRPAIWPRMRRPFGPNSEGDTMGFAGNSTKLTKSIRKFFKIKEDKKIPEQAHHLLASSVVLRLDTEFFKKQKIKKGTPRKRYARAAGYKLNEQPNGILLPIRFGHQHHLNLVRHRGRHGSDYFDKIYQILKPIYDDFLKEGKDVCGDDRQEFLDEFEAAEKDVRSQLTSDPPTLWLYKWSEELWTKDYCDEGATDGRLRSTRGIVDDAATGLEWVEKMVPGPIKRRYMLQGKNKVPKYNQEWYTKKSYPDPGGLK
jgi:hypothetical protein